MLASRIRHNPPTPRPHDRLPRLDWRTPSSIILVSAGDRGSAFGYRPQVQRVAPEGEWGTRLSHTWGERLS